MVKKEKLSYQLKTPKGTRDHTGSELQLRNEIFDTIKTVFKRHGAQELDTPVFELTEVLRGNYGEDSKLIYDLQDQGGELCSLRYDLTVPFARWLALNPDVKNYDRYAIGKVYRRDQPAMGKGRMREFYQCDIDMAGAGSDPMIPDAEIIRIVMEVFEGLKWHGRYTIKLNHRKILDGVFEVCGVPAEKTRTISSAVDKLDKSPWTEVRREMVEEKGLTEEVADKIKEYVMLKGGKDLLEKLKADQTLMKSEGAKAGIEDMTLLLQYLEVYEVLDKISFDMSLARGLDYYTGVIYEVITEGSAPVQVNGTEQAQQLQKSSKKEKKATEDDDRSDDPTVGVGSVAAGGRYDKLVNKFLPNANMPCVGVSFGIERIFAIEKARRQGQSKASEADVWIVAMGDGLILPRMKIAKDLWNAGIRAQYTRKLKAKFQTQFGAAEKASVPFAVIVGEGELQNGEVRIKEMGLPEGHPEKEGLKVKLEDLAVEVKRRLALKAENIAEMAEIVGGATKMSVEDEGQPKATDPSRQGAEL